MKHIALAACLGAFVVPAFVTPAFVASAFAHGPPPPARHGGILAETSDEHWVELVLNGTRMTVYVSNAANQPVPSSRLGGKATVLVGGKAQQVALAPAEANSLAGTLDPAATGKVTSVVTLSIEGKPTQARFATNQP